MTADIHHPRRALGLASLENGRDLGGYLTETGRETCWGVFLRSGDMHAVSKTDQDRLRSLGVNTVIDLRMEHERLRAPSVFKGSQVPSYRVHDFWGRRFDHYRSADKTASPAIKLADLYCQGLVKSGFVMAEIMTTLADEASGTCLFHCRSGKDRTGLVAAMLLAVAGVPEATICADFALTADYLRAPAVNPVAEDEAQSRVAGAWQKTCEPETMSRTLGFIRANFGDVPGYLKHVGVSEMTLATLRQRLLG